MTRENDAAAVAGDGAMVAPACAMVIFGAAGDLTKRLVVPALYDLVSAKRLPERFQLVGVDLAAKTAAATIRNKLALAGIFRRVKCHKPGRRTGQRRQRTKANEIAEHRLIIVEGAGIGRREPGLESVDANELKAAIGLGIKPQAFKNLLRCVAPVDNCDARLCFVI